MDGFISLALVCRIRYLAKGSALSYRQGESQKEPLRQLGSAVFPLALGCMGMSGMYGPADERESIATIHAALERGVTLLDTGDFYGMGHNEMLVGRALRRPARPGARSR